MVAQKNIIKKVEIGVNTPSYENGLQLKDGLDAFFKEKIFPEMDNYFNSIQMDHSKIVRIEKISIEIDVEQNNLVNDLKLLIIKELKKIISIKNISRNNNGNLQIVSPEKNGAEAFFHFLETGQLPWWFENKTNFWEDFIDRNFQNKIFIKNLKSGIKEKDVRKRLIFQFGDEALLKICSSLLKKNLPQNLEINLPQTYRNAFWEAVLNYSILKNKKEIVSIFQDIPLMEIEKLLQKVDRYFDSKISYHLKKTQTDIKKEANAFDLKNTEKQVSSQKKVGIEKDGRLVANAGLILLHPFLKMFFEKLDLLSEKKIKIEKIDEAVHLLHYLATGKEKAYEHELLFEKFLCNVPFQQPINRHIELTKDQKMACEVLLQAVLGHWESLKSKSTELLQNEFLQRDGKLIISEEKQTLIVERKTQDILLERIPWNIHLIKIPWKEKILFVEW